MASILKVDTIQDQSGNNIINENADTITIGASGDTITVPTGATLTVPSGGLSGQNYPAFEAYLSADQTVTDGTVTKAQIDTEVLDTDGYYDNTTNYRFTPLVAGKYFVYGNIMGDSGASSNLQWTQTRLYKNGSEFRRQTIQFTANPGRQAAVSIFAIVDMNGTTDYVELYGSVNTADGGNGEFYGTSSAPQSTYFGAYRIGD